MSDKKLLSFTNFNKGINTTASFDELAPEELTEAVNIDLKVRGGYTQRDGSSISHQIIDSGSDPLQYPVSRLIDYPETPLLVINKSLRKLDNTVITLLLNSNNIEYEFFTNSKLYLLDGTDYLVYDGTTCSSVVATLETASLTAIKRCKFLIQRGQRMFAAGDPQNPNYLYFSEIGTPENFLPASVVKAVTDDNDKLTGLAVFSDCLLAFKKKTIFKWTGWDPTSDVKFTELDTGHGAVCQGTIQVSDDYLIFADDSGVYCLETVDTSLIKSYNISKSIEEEYHGLINRENMRSVVYKGNYYLACCTSGSSHNNLVLKASLGMAYNGSSDEGVSSLLFPWVTYSGWDVSDWMIINDELYFASSEDGQIHKAFDGVDDEVWDYTTHARKLVPVSSRVSHYLKIEDPVVRKKLKRLFLIALQETSYPCKLILDVEAGYNKVSKEIVLDESGSWDITNWDEVLWDWVDVVTKEIRIGKKATRVKITLSHSRVGEKMTIYGFAVYYKSKKPRGTRNGISDI